MSDLPDLDVFEILDKLGVEQVHPASGGQEASFSCPFHEDNKPSAYMNTETTAWMCWSCHERGRTAVSFVAKVLGVQYATAAEMLREAYGVDFREPEGGSMAAETDARFAPISSVPELRRPVPSWQETFAANLYSDVGARAFEYIRSRGLSAETISSWGIGYDSISGRLTIPVYDHANELVGFKGRAVEGESPKYAILGDRQGGNPVYGFDFYEAATVVFGLHAGGPDVLVLCEGELNAVALNQAGVTCPVAIGMSYLSDRHAQLISSRAREVVVFFDSDEAGSEGVFGHVSASGSKLPGVVEKLQPHVVVKVVPEHEGDPMSWFKENPDQAPSKIHDLIGAARSALVDEIASR